MEENLVRMFHNDHSQQHLATFHQSILIPIMNQLWKAKLMVDNINYTDKPFNNKHFLSHLILYIKTVCVYIIIN